MFMEWDERFTTGVEIVDRQHRGLIHILNGLYEQIGKGRGETAILGVLGEFQRYADYHFDTEERLLKKHAAVFRVQAAHLASHDAYRHRIEALRQRQQAGEALVPVQVMAFVVNWWSGHILNDDRIYVSLASREAAADARHLLLPTDGAPG